MLPASEALSLPSAQLTDDELVRANALEAEIDEHIRKFMERRGCDFRTNETNANVIAEVNQRIKAAGYQVTWQGLVERHKLNAALTSMVGWQAAIAPGDEAWRSRRSALVS